MKRKKSYFIIGLMSGTSMDGIDASFIKSNGLTLERLGINCFEKYSKETYELLALASKKPSAFLRENKNLEQINFFITKDHCNIVNKMINNNNISPDYIGFHGQTLFHHPQKNISIQLGDSQFLANSLNTRVISNFRENDIRHKGQGAPIAPIYHKYLIESLGVSFPSCFINIGGLTNLTYCDDDQLIGFDTGPGNVLIDQYCQTYLNLNFDNKGSIARLGKVNKKLINNFLRNSFFKKQYPKSLDKFDFKEIFNNIKSYEMNDFDILATLTEMTVISIKLSIEMLPQTPLNIIISGGGQNNNYLIERIKTTFNFNVKTARELGLPGDFIEAELIGYLTARNLNRLPLTFPETTGVKKPLLGGVQFIPNF